MAAAGENSDLIDQFVLITDANQEQARFYLESAHWDFEVAVSSFFEHDQPANALDSSPAHMNDLNNPNDMNTAASNDDVQIIEDRHKNTAKSSQVPKTAANAQPANFNQQQQQQQTSKKQPAAAKQQQAKSQPAPQRRFATLSDLGRDRQNNDSSDSDSGNESPHDPNAAKKDSSSKQQQFYVGGGEHSGQQVLGPKKPNANEIVDKVFKQAKALGAVEAQSSSSNNSATNDRSPSVFGGLGIRLGDSTTGSTLVGPREPGRQVGGQQQQRPPGVARIRVAMYRNGFVVDDGPLRTYDDPQSKMFITAIMRQQIPHELTVSHPGAEIDLQLENHQTEEYIPKRSVQAFAGQGYMLGGLSVNVQGAGQVGVKSQEAAKAENGSSNGVSTNNQIAEQPVPMDIDEAKPTTRLQIRLHNGQRIVARFNVNHQLTDVRDYILRQPQNNLTQFALVSNMTIPPTKLADENVTLEQAGILNASISQTKA